MIDEATFTVRAGHGGSGTVSFRREKFIPKGGPDGGDGGDGGSVYLETDLNLNTLRFFAGKTKFEAKSGGRGSKQKKHGKNAQDLTLMVPVGTTVYQASQGNIWLLLADLNKPHQRALIAQGGLGGRGNWQFRSSTNTTPKEFEMGTRGEVKIIKLELKLLANVGLVGLPNAGKSTLLSVLTKARPQIANYPFTTISPNLGVMEFKGAQSSQRRARFKDPKGEVSTSNSLVIADIPGLIEGASIGKGLGIQFLKHIERCLLLVFVIAPRDHELNESAAKLVKSLLSQLNEVKNEMQTYNPKLLDLPAIITLNKTDLLSDKTVTQIITFFQKEGIEVLPISSATKSGIDRLTIVITTTYNQAQT